MVLALARACRVSATQVFPCVVGLLELCAGIVYATHRQWALAVAWTAYAVAAICFAVASPR